MSVESALDKLKTSLDAVADLPNVDIGGVPDTVLTGVGKDPSFYLEPSREDFQHGSLRQESLTSSIAEFTGVVVYHLKHLPSGKKLPNFLWELVARLRKKLEDEGGAGTYQSDGDVGFTAALTSVEYHHRPNDPVAAFVFRIRVTAYAK